MIGLRWTNTCIRTGFISEKIFDEKWAVCNGFLRGDRWFIVFGCFSFIERCFKSFSSSKITAIFKHISTPWIERGRCYSKRNMNRQRSNKSDLLSVRQDVHSHFNVFFIFNNKFNWTSSLANETNIEVFPVECTGKIFRSPPARVDFFSSVYVNKSSY